MACSPPDEGPPWGALRHDAQGDPAVPAVVLDQGEPLGQLSAHTHLVVGGQLPNSYIRSLDHHNSWYIGHQRWKEEGVPYSWRSKFT
jgi:hypothetical protein